MADSLPWKIMKRKLIYISPLRYPSEKAGSLFSVKSCEAFAKAGLEVELWVPKRRNVFASRDSFMFYGVKNNFKIVRFFAIDTMPFFYLPLAISFAFSVFFYTLLKGRRDWIYYSHEEYALFLLTLIRRQTVYEIHDFPGKNFLYRLLLNRVYGIITNNYWKKDHLQHVFGADGKKVFAVPNGVEPDEFLVPLDQKTVRQKLRLPQGKKIILYTGSFASWKGTDTLLEASKLLPEYLVYLAGGSEKEINDLQNKIKFRSLKNVVAAGRKSHSEIPLWLKAADVLVIPNTAKKEISKFYTSPMKLFEYMASGVPTAASDIPSIRQIADEKVVSFFKPDQPESLAKAIQEIFSNYTLAQDRACHAQVLVKEYSWGNRAHKIIDFLRFPADK